MSGPQYQPPPFDLAYLFNQASYALAARMGDALAGLGLNVGQYCILAKASETERTQVEIAQLAALDKTTVVKAVDELERNGFATRHVHPGDRRARIVELTALGHAKLVDAHHAIAQVYAHALSDLSPEDQERLVGSLTAMTRGALGTPSHVTALRRRRTPRPS